MLTLFLHAHKLSFTDPRVTNKINLVNLALYNIQSNL